MLEQVYRAIKGLHAHHALSSATAKRTARGSVDSPAMRARSGEPLEATRCNRQPSAACHSASERSPLATASRSDSNKRHRSHWRNIPTRVAGGPCMHRKRAQPFRSRVEVAYRSAQLQSFTQCGQISSCFRHCSLSHVPAVLLHTRQATHKTRQDTGLGLESRDVRLVTGDVGCLTVLEGEASLATPRLNCRHRCLCCCPCGWPHGSCVARGRQRRFDRHAYRICCHHTQNHMLGHNATSTNRFGRSVVIGRPHNSNVKRCIYINPPRNTPEHELDQGSACK